MDVDPVRLLVCLVAVGVAFASTGGAVATAVDGGSPVVATDTQSQRLSTIGDPAGPAPALVTLQNAPETDNTITRIVVHANGSATWTLQDRFRENTSRYLGNFREGITGIVGTARQVTGREMEAGSFAASTSIQTIPRRWGVVTFAFRWDGFAPTERERLVVGDVFEGGLFIAEGDSLEVRAPAGYRIASSDPAPDESTASVATWEGREDFADRRPRVVLEPAGGVAGTGWLPSPVLLGGAAVIALGVLATLGYRRYARQRYADAPSETAGATETAATASGDTSTNASAPDDDVPMADEDHVLAALEEHGGRMRQQAVGEALDWSRSKTSRVLGRMAEAGQVKKLQLGRENVIALPGELEDRDRRP